MVATFDEVADELYAVPPEEFIAARTERQQEAKAAGDKELAREIGALSKPPTAAWVVNVLTRRRPDEMAQLVELGELMREAQSTLEGEQLKQFSRQRHQVLDAMVRQARALARELGHPISTAVAVQVEETLRAAIADPRAGEAVLTGRLTAALDYSGLGEIDLSSAVAAPAARRPARTPAPSRTPARAATRPARTRVDDVDAEAEAAREADREAEREAARQREREARQRELREARRELEEATAAAERATADAAERAARVQAIEEQQTGLQQRVDDLTRQLQRAQDELEVAAEELGHAARERREAERRALTAERARERAQAHIDRLRPTAAD
jgi:hypothetical protein